MNRAFTSEQLRIIQQVEVLALKLDQGCRSGAVEDAMVAKAQVFVSHAADKLVDVDELTNPEVYILYEAQALIQWIRGEEDEAYNLVDRAQTVRGKGKLFTESARGLANKIGSISAEDRESLIQSFKSTGVWAVITGALVCLWAGMYLLLGDYGMTGATALIALIFIHLGVKIIKLPSVRDMKSLLVLLSLMSLALVAGILPLICLVKAIMRLMQMKRYEAYVNENTGDVR